MFVAYAMTDIDTRPAMSASGAAAVLDRLRAGPRAAPQPNLSPEALAVAGKPPPAPISPIVLAGAVRMAEFALIVLVGLGIYAVYLPSGEGLVWRYVGAIVAIATLSMLAFQIRRHLPGAGLPRPREAIHAPGLGLVGGVPHRHQRARSSPKPG